MPRLPRRLTVVLASLALVGVLTPATATPTAATDGSTFVSVANRYRSEAGVGPVALHSVIDRIAVERGNELAADQKLGHDFPALIARLDQLDVCWEQLGEIVAYNQAPAGERIEKFMNQWYNSATHKAIMLGSGFTHAGGSWKTGSDGNHYGVMVFVRLCGATPAQPTVAGFTDIADSKFRADIVWLVNEGITNGCAPDRFCPDGLVTRDQMASFLRRAMDLGAAPKDFFRDDEANKHESNINSVAAVGLTRGCDPGMYCPSGRVTRAQMASFLVRALGLPPAPRDYFWDDETSSHEDAINRLAAAGITSGCATGRFCPNGVVTRGQMAAFLHRAFD